MTANLRQQPISRRSKAGTVKVRREIRVPPTRVWQALTDCAHVALWFGDLSAPLCPGQSSRLDFGDGDFFTIENVELSPPYYLRYDWRFLGTGPLDTIKWFIDPIESGCRVTVVDSEPERSREAAAALKIGWLDFSKRLKSYCTAGKSARYPWRRDFEGSIELPVSLADAWQRLFDGGAQRRWLPLASGILCDGARFMTEDGDEPSWLPLTQVTLASPNRVAFALTSTQWYRPTECVIELFARVHGTILSIRHTAWLDIGHDDDYQKWQRRRFCNFWIAALKRAREAVSGLGVNPSVEEQSYREASPGSR